MKEGDQEILTVVDWSETLNFFDLSGKQLTKERWIGFNPLSLEFFSNGDYLLISGISGEVLLYTKDGVLIGPVVRDDHWIWSAKPSHEGNFVVSINQLFDGC